MHMLQCMSPLVAQSGLFERAGRMSALGGKADICFKGFSPFMRGGKKRARIVKKNFYAGLTPHLQAGRWAFFAQCR